MPRYIDADKLLKDIEQYHLSDGCFQHWVEVQPTIELRKKGKWIPQDHNKTNGLVSTAVYYCPKCSVCGLCGNYTNFCPNCGTEMENNNGPIC